MNHYSLISPRDCNFNLSCNILGKDFIVDRSSENTIDDDLLEKIILINRLNFVPVSQKYKKLLSSLNSKNLNVTALVGSKKIKESTLDFKKLLNRDISDYYFKVLLKRYSLTSSLSSAKYDHTTTLTGRMKITAGENYLTMKKSERLSLKKNPDNLLIEIDVKSCEPALLNALLYGKTEGDIYALFCEQGISRAKVKIAVISSLYGSKIDRVCSLSGLSRATIKKIHKHFQIERITNDLQDTFQKDGYFRNLYGRPIYEINSPINYWLQSSAADYCCLAFKDLVDTNNLTLRAVIHDAIIVETSSEKYEEIKNIHSVVDPITGIKLLVDNACIA
tara:strand:+ start:787 stop:1788 length:1002 start_codon:yes stop_codon:yes gene_type:complete